MYADWLARIHFRKGAGFSEWDPLEVSLESTERHLANRLPVLHRWLRTCRCACQRPARCVTIRALWEEHFQSLLLEQAARVLRRCRTPSWHASRVRRDDQLLF